MKHKHLDVFIVRFDFPATSAEAFETLRSHLLQYHFSPVVADKHGIPRALPSDTYAIASFMSLHEVTVFIHKIVAIVPEFHADMHILPRDEYFAADLSSR